MAKTNEKGPRKLEKDAYNELKEEQEQQHINSLSKAGSGNQASGASLAGSGEPWRKNAQPLQQQQDYYQQEDKEVPVQYKMEEKKVSKHAKRRAKKKLIQTSAAADEDDNE